MPGKLFPLGGPVSEHDLVGRADFINSLKIRLSEGNSVMLTGPRRIGKTSIALEVLRRLKSEGFHGAFIDLFRISTKKELAMTIIDACLENRSGLHRTTDAIKEGAKKITGIAKLAVKLKGLEVNLGLPGQEKGDNELLEYALQLPELMAERDKKQTVLVFDEFQDVIRIAGEETLKIMRSHFQLHKTTSYLFLGSKEGMMNNMFSNKNQAFYRFATILPMPAIEEDSWLDYVSGKLAERNVLSRASDIREIIRMSGGHPQDTMLVCSETYYALLEGGQDQLSLEFLRIGFERALLTLTPVFDEILDEIGKVPHARKTIIALAQGIRIYSGCTNPNEVKRAVDFLVAKALIEKTGRGTYAFIEPMFKEYLIRNIDVY